MRPQTEKPLDFTTADAQRLVATFYPFVEKTVRSRLCLIIVFVLAEFAGYCQDIPGSIYSSFGYGNLHERSSAYTRALGNTSIAVRSENFINITNPAALTSISAPFTSMFEIGTYYGSTYINGTEGSNTNKYGSLSGVNYWFRLSKKWASMVGVSPVSNTAYSVVAPRVLNGYASVPVESDGKGGITQFYFGNGVELFKNFSAGVNFSYYLGTIKRSDQVPSTAVSSLFQAEQQLTASGANLDFGIQYSIPIKKTTFVLGAIYDHGASLHGHNQIALVNPVTFDTIRANEKNILHTRLPAVYGGGLSAKRKRSTLAVDVRYMNWSIASFDQTYIYNNVIKTSFGYEYKGDITSFSYYKTLSVRAGAWYQDYPIAIQGTKINTWGYTLGVVFPVQTNRAAVSLNYSFTQIGYAKNELVREQGRYLSLDIIVRDVWGFKRPLD